MSTLIRALVVLVLLLAAVPVRAFDHSHAAWQQLLARHVVLDADGTASRVRYAAFQADRPALKAYLSSLSAISPDEYAGWTKDEQLAFLINAYNAFTVELILTRYPDLASIKDLGSLFRSPWRQPFFTLLGKEQTLDGIEHDLIRAPGVFREPRIHAAVVCASVGCPMLRDEAYVATRLDVQLEDAMTRFLKDRRRNRLDLPQRTAQVSKLFDWYAGDFERGDRGFDSLQATFAHYAQALADSPEGVRLLREGRYTIDYLDYDWSLNDAR